MGTVVKHRVRKWQKAEDNTVQTKGAGPFSDFLVLNCQRLMKGRYRIQWNWEARLQSGSTSLPSLRCTLDGSGIGSRVFKSPDQNWDQGSGWDFEQFDEGDKPVLKIQARRIGGTDTVEMKRLKLSIELMEVT